MVEFRSRSAEETRALGERIGARLREGDIVALEGGLGAGKTTLAQGIAQGLGIAEPVTSPTYTIVSEYQGRLRLYHVDAYRLSGPEDFGALGGEEYLFGQGVCVVEWSERLQGCLPGSALRIRMECLEGSGRIIRIQGPGSEYLDL